MELQIKQSDVPRQLCVMMVAKPLGELLDVRTGSCEPLRGSGSQDAPRQQPGTIGGPSSRAGAISSSNFPHYVRNQNTNDGVGTSTRMREEIHLDGAVLGFALLASTFAGLLAGLVPALQVTQPPLLDVLKKGAGGSASKGRARMALVVAEIALALMLTNGAP